MLMIGRGCDRGHDGFGGLVDNGGSSIPPRCPQWAMTLCTFLLVGKCKGASLYIPFPFCCIIYDRGYIDDCIAHTSLTFLDILYFLACIYI